jgi:serine phosphatase RsbU (regulator of sigma subunit)
MDYVEIVDAQGRRRHVELTRPRLLIGREPTCDICLPHPSVSRRHAQLQETEHGMWMLQDLHSLNHIYVDNREVQQILLEPGMSIRIAEYRLVLLPSAETTGIEPGTLPMIEDSSESWSVLDTSWLEHMQAFQRTLHRLEEPRLVLERLAQEFLRIAHPELVAIGVASGDGYNWEVVVPEQARPALLMQAPELSKRLTPDESDVKTWSEQGSNGDTPCSTAPMCLLFPMKGRGTILGHVYLQRPRLSPVPPAMQRYLALLATHAGLVRENLQLAVLRVAQKVIEQELRQARQIQIELFPATTDVDERLNACAVNLPSVSVSGDYYDLIRTGRDRIAFVIADAMGHGMPAALMMAAVRASLRMGLSLGMAWPKVFQGLDEIIMQARHGAFVTGLVGEIDLKAGSLDLVSAGHFPPSVLVAGRPVALPPTCRTRPWGLDFEVPWQVGRIELGKEDWSVVCFTDGITEAVTKSGRVFGHRAVAAFHQSNHQLSAEDLCQGLIGEVATQQRTVSLSDDQTVLVLRSVMRPAKTPATRQMSTLKDV